MFYTFILVLPCLLLGLLVLLAATINSNSLRKRGYGRRKAILSSLSLPASTQIVAFFHPYCNAGGGGERVLWTLIASIQKTDPSLLCAVYTGDVDASKAEILAKVHSRFSISLDPSRLHFVFLTQRKWIEDSSWPAFTLLGQSLGSIWLLVEALQLLVPDLFVDSMGYAFTFPIVSRIARVPVVAYVHYPTISTDMLQRVRERKAWHTNTQAISSSSLLSTMKLLYYRIFMYLYSNCLQSADFIMVNSTWTKSHIDSILQHSDVVASFLFAGFHVAAYISQTRHRPAIREAKIVYPPCDTRAMRDFPLEGREKVILSVAQFRPEKDHPMQLKAYHRFIQLFPSFRASTKLVLIGGSRNQEDADRVHSLKELAKNLGIEANVEFVVNASYADVLSWLSKSSIGLSTMVDEHFGINVVEYMAAGLIPVAHKSGGPLKDIVVPVDDKRTGYHAVDADTYAEVFRAVLELDADDDLEMRMRARRVAVERFSEEEFVRGWEESRWRDYLTHQ